MGELAQRTISKAVEALVGVIADAVVEYVKNPQPEKRKITTTHRLNDGNIKVSVGLK